MVHPPSGDVHPDVDGTCRYPASLIKTKGFDSKGFLMSVHPVLVIFGLSFPPVFVELILSLLLFWIVKRILTPTGIYDLVWHPSLFNTALYCCVFYLVSSLMV